MRKFFLKNKKAIITALIAFIVLTIFFLLIPYTHDDWAWGGDVSSIRLKSGFKDYGGRYLGYILIMTMTRNNLLKAIVMSATIICIAILFICATNKVWPGLLAILLIFLIPTEVFNQTITWASGFANYVTSALISLLVFCILMKSNEIKGVKNNTITSIIMLIICLAGSLFMEYVTLYLIAISIFFVAYSRIKDGKISPIAIAGLFGSVVGAIIMFSNSAYWNIASSSDSYRAIAPMGILNSIVINFVNYIAKYGLFSNVILNICLAYILISIKTSNRVSIFTKNIYVVYVMYSIFIKMMISESSVFIECFNAFFSLFALFALIIFIYSCCKDGILKNKKELTVATLSYFILLAPLFIISPLSERCIFPAYIFLAYITITMLNDIIKTNKILNKKIEKLLYISTTTLIAVLLLVFVQVKAADFYRHKYIEEKISINEPTVMLKELPFKHLLYNSQPIDNRWQYRFKNFYHYPENINIINER